ncbi:uncharacterized protein JN550_008374 [Neoarthrinium moseri]|uniref:uncharacterized protein n=1 Tax=Neoarthrinium moseri TaxID=1658444 RepID=UPI001FDDDB64|nr:uncharacterized protein JN550_008374 [Neoarthrinium moseri]KAI1865326.1 hypothetical protein JN550_008374 [Neoarthrinium moseri]
MEQFVGFAPQLPLQEANHIRVVILLPGAFDDPIKCALEHVELLPNSDYEAVSYSWGDATVTKPILVNDRIYPVTTNLFTALQYLRNENMARRLWIDSICINQTDLDERNREVRKMREIYCSASQLLIWLGDYSPMTEEDVSLVFYFVEALFLAGQEERKAEYVTNLGIEAMWRLRGKLKRFLESRSWLFRVWILQEVAVRPVPHDYAPEITPLVICGVYELPWFHFTLLSLYWDRDPRAKFRLDLHPPEDNLWRIIAVSELHGDMLERDRPLADQIACYLSFTAGSFQATDERDRIYSLTGLFRSGQIPAQLLPDYRKPMSQILFEYAIYLLKDPDLIDIIQFNSGTSIGLPSWVPDWQHHAPKSWKMVEEKDRFGGHCRVDEERRCLEVETFTFAHVLKVVLQVPKYQHHSSVSAWLDDVIKNTANSIDVATQDHPVEQDMANLCFQFNVRRNFVQDVNLHETVLKGEHGYSSLRSFRAVDTRLHSSPTLVDLVSLDDMWHEIMESTTDRYIFYCADGSLGIVAQKCVSPIEGDIICSIKGASSEFILRPHGDRYVLIGYCQRTRIGHRFHASNLGLSKISDKILQSLKDSWDEGPLVRMLIC